MSLIRDFELTVGLGEGLVPGPPRIATRRGVSVGTGAGGRISVALLSVEGQDPAAGALAEAWLAGGGQPDGPTLPTAPFVVLDSTTASVAVVMPRIGLRLVYWRAADGMLAVASRPDRLGAGSGAPRIDCDAIYRYVYFHALPGPSSIFEGVAKLEAGHWLRWDGRRAQIERHWRPRFEDRARFDEAVARDELMNRLRGAVARSLAGGLRGGAFLSGGLDSSTVAGLAAEVAPGVPTVSMGFDAQGYDEMEYARIASRHFRTTPLEYYVTPDDVLSTLPALAAAFPEPFGNSSAAAAYHCARIAREHGLQLLLAGDGGDELFGGNERYARQLLFERYLRLPALLRTGVIEPVVAAASRFTRAFPVGKAASYVEQARVPLPDRLQSYNFLHRHSPAEIFSPALLERAWPDRPIESLREEYRVPETASAVNRMLFLDWKFTLHDNDLVKVNAMCAHAGVDVAYPFLDPEVVDFSLQLPGDWKVRNGELRWFYRRAMHGFLPPEILAKRKHGFGLPFGVWTRTHDGLRRLSEHALDSLGQRGYFRTDFLREALRLHREGHAAYYGELVWILMALELWLQGRHPAARL
jgi:asparagine synthase (glutamine-hydrolysing)